jgi:hypothetical protein
MIHELVNAKSHIRPRRRHGIDLHVLDPRMRRAASQCRLESLKRLFVTFGNRFDTTIRQVPDDAGQVFATGDVQGEIPKADALHSAAHHESASSSHLVERINEK